MRTCTRCWEERPVEQFGRFKRNPDGIHNTCKPCLRTGARKYYGEKGKAVQASRRGTGFHRKWSLKRNYGITHTEFEEMEARQNKSCAICGDVVKLAVDHNHKTGKVRGLLCLRCNWGIGHLRDNPEILQSAINYLEKEIRL